MKPRWQSGYALVYKDSGQDSIAIRDMIYFYNQYGCGVDPASQKFEPDSFHNVLWISRESKGTRNGTDHPTLLCRGLKHLTPQRRETAEGQILPFFFLHKYRVMVF